MEDGVNIIFLVMFIGGVMTALGFLGLLSIVYVFFRVVKRAKRPDDEEKRD